MGGNPALAVIEDLVITNVSGSIVGGRGAGIGSGVPSANSDVTIQRLSFTDIPDRLSISSIKGAAIGSGDYTYGSYAMDEIIIQDSVLGLHSEQGSGIGIGAFVAAKEDDMFGEGPKPLVLHVSLLNITGSDVEIVSDESSGIAMAFSDNVDDTVIENASLPTINIENSQVKVVGTTAIGREVEEEANETDDCRVSFQGPVNLSCDSTNGLQPCTTCHELAFAGDHLALYIVTRSVGPLSGNVTRAAYVSGSSWVAYSRASRLDPVFLGYSLHFGRLFAERARVFKFIVTSRGSEDYEKIEFDYNTSSSKGLNILLPGPGSFRVTYAEQDEEIGSVCDDNDVDVFDVTKGDMFIARATMVDFPGPPEPLPSWAVFFILIGVVLILLISVTMFIIWRYRVWQLEMAEDSLPPEDAEATPDEGKKEGGEEGDPLGTALLISEKLRQEFRERHGALGVIRWIFWVIARLWIMFLMVLIAYLGLVALLYFSFLILFSFLVAVFMNTLAKRGVDLQVQILTWMYVVPFAQFLFSLNVAAIGGLFSDLAANLDFVAVTRALARPKEKGHRFVFFDRWAWYFYYFAVMTAMFIISLIDDGSDMAQYVSFVFGAICTIVPILALIRPLVTAWQVWLFDRENLEFVPEASSGEGAEAKHDDGILLTNQPGDDQSPAGDGEPEATPGNVAPEAKLLSKSKLGRTWQNLAGHQTMFLVDPSGLLKDDTWVDYLHDPATGHARPRFCDFRTWIVTGLAFLWLVIIMALEGVRYNYVLDEREQMANRMEAYIKGISDEYEVPLGAAAIPATDGVLISLIIRVIILVLVFPFTVLSHHASLLMPKRSKYLEKKHANVQSAMLTGLIFFLGGFVVMIAAACMGAIEPWFSTDEIYSTPLTAGDNPMSTLEEPHSLCRQSVSDWSLLQLAGMTILGDARVKNYTTYKQLANLLNIPLLEDDEYLKFYTTALFAFNRTDKRLLVAPPAIPFVDNYGVYLENSLSDWFGGFIDEAVPLYGIASTLFLGSFLESPSEILVSGILGPNRLTEEWLNNATLSVKQELEVIQDIMDAIGLSTDRPVFMGHGAAGLIAKALQFESGTDPWRVAFESSPLADRPMATLSGASENEAALSKIINFYGMGSIFAKDDEAALTNHRMPVYPEASELIPHPREFIPPHAFKTFCEVVAACGSDPILDNMCDQAFPDEFKDGMCELYGRPRSQ